MSEKNTKEESIQEDAPKQLSPEELAEKRKIMKKNYQDQISILTLQLDYEKLLADIEQARAKRMEMIIRQAQMSAGPEAASEAPESEKKERKLKAN